MSNVVSIKNGEPAANKITASEVLETVELIKDNIDSIAIVMTIKGSQEVHVSANVSDSDVIRLIQSGLIEGEL